jgi:hypothetical protein
VPAPRIVSDGLPVHGAEGEAGADLAPEVLGHGLGVGPLGGQDQDVAGGGAGLGQLGEQSVDGAAVVGVLEVAVDLFDQDHRQRHPVAGAAGDLGGDLALGADVIREAGHALEPGVHVLHRVGEDLDEGLDRGGPHAGHVEVGDPGEGFEVLAALAIGDHQPRVGIQRGRRGGDAGRVGLTHPWDRPDQQRGPDQRDRHGATAGVETEGERRPEVPRLRPDQGRVGRGLLVGVPVRDPRDNPARRAGGPALAFQEHPELVDVQPGRDLLAAGESVGGGLARGQLDHRPDPGTVMSDRGQEPDRSRRPIRIKRAQTGGSERLDQQVRGDLARPRRYGGVLDPRPVRRRPHRPEHPHQPGDDCPAGDG